MQEQYPVEEIALADIFLDRDTQIRASVDEETIRRYFEIMVDEEARDKFPPVLFFRDKYGKLWLADGHHRIMAAIRRGFASILATVRPGSKEDAIWAAVKANAQNGLPLGRADVRRAVIMVLKAFPKKSTTSIAEVVGCSQPYVSKVKSQVITSYNLTDAEPEMVEGKDGKMYKARKTRESKTEPKSDTAPPPPPEAEAPTKTENAPQTDGQPADANECDASPFEELEGECFSGEAATDEGRRAEADSKELDVVAATENLRIQIEEWFAVAPDDMWAAFAGRNRERIGALID